MKIIGLILILITIAGAIGAQNLPPVDREPVTVDSTRDVETVTRDKTAVGTTARETLIVKDMAFGIGVENREPVGKASEFAADAGRLFFWSEIANTGDSAIVAHIWYRGDTERARVRLPVAYFRNRIWSSKGIAPGDTGAWRVEIWGPDSVMLAVDSCRVKSR